MSNLKKIISENNKDYRDIKNSFEKAINIGERLAIAKNDFDTMEDFEEWVSANHDFKYRQATTYIRIAKHKQQARLIFSNSPEISVESVQKQLPRTAEDPIITEANKDNMAYVGSKPGEARDSDNWHTPVEYIDSARKVMGGINLDPFSDYQANEIVKADRILTIADDSLNVTWADPETRTVWMNPPYSRGMSSLAVDKFIDELNYGSFDTAIVLMNSSTDTNWFHRMATISSAICFTKGRIAFISTDGKKSSGNTKGQVFFYIGRDVEKFRKVFCIYGLILPHSTGRTL